MYTTEYYPAIEKNKQPIHAMTLMNLTDTTLNERRQKQREHTV